MELNKIKKFTSKLDGCKFDYFISRNPNVEFYFPDNYYLILSYKIEGTSNWQDFIPNDKRAYTKEQYQEMLDLLEGKLEGTLEGEFIAGFHD